DGRAGCRGRVLGLLRAKPRRASFTACHLACGTTAADPTLPARDHRSCRALLECCTMSVPVSGTEGYAEQAEELFKHYESLAALEVHRAVLHLIPQSPCRVLDIGSGTGRDAAWFADMGHGVVVFEPPAAMRLGARSFHPSSRIEWLNDCLPDLTVLRSR